MCTGAWLLRQEYQDRIIAETAMFRPNGNGDSLFTQFWEHWQQERARDTTMGGCKHKHKTHKHS